MLVHRLSRVRRSRVALALALVVCAAATISGCAGPESPVAPPGTAAGSGAGGVGADDSGSATETGADSVAGSETGADSLVADRRWWWAVEALTRECMADASFPAYGLAPPWVDGAGHRSGESWLASLPTEARAPARTALFGDPAASTWHDTGCAGRALHDVGVD